MKIKTLVFTTMLFLATSIAYAIPYGFQNITNNNAVNAATGEAQLWVDVLAVDGVANQVMFTFHNNGPLPCSITDVYFDDGHIIGSTLEIINSSGVAFSQYASPGNLPGGNAIGFDATEYFGYYTADSDPAAQPNGVNPYESLGIRFTLINNNVFSNIVSDLNSGALRIGIHVQGFEDGGSESFVNTPAPVPEPATMLLLGSGLLGLAGFRKRASK